MNFPEPGSSALLGDLFTAMGYVIGAAVYFYIGRRDKNTDSISSNVRRWILAAAVIGGVIGARLTQWLVLGWPLYGEPERILYPDVGGRTILGGLLTGWAAVEIAKRRLGVFVSTGLPFAFALPAGELVGRIGCWFSGCCGGIEAFVPWAVKVDNVSVHPTQLYSILAALIMLLAMAWILPRLREPGDLFKIYIVMYGGSRFFIEFYRRHDMLILGLSLAQWVCLQLFLGGSLVLIVNSFRRAGKWQKNEV